MRHYGTQGISTDDKNMRDTKAGTHPCNRIGTIPDAVDGKSLLIDA